MQHRLWGFAGVVLAALLAAGGCGFRGASGATSTELPVPSVSTTDTLVGSWVPVSQVSSGLGGYPLVGISISPDGSAVDSVEVPVSESRSVTASTPATWTLSGPHVVDFAYEQAGTWAVRSSYSFQVTGVGPARQLSLRWLTGGMSPLPTRGHPSSRYTSRLAAVGRAYSSHPISWVTDSTGAVVLSATQSVPTSP